MNINNKLPKWLRAIFIVTNMGFCRHKYANAGKKRIFNDPVMDSNGKLAYAIQLMVCKKCGKIKYFSAD